MSCYCYLEIVMLLRVLRIRAIFFSTLGFFQSLVRLVLAFVCANRKAAQSNSIYCNDIRECLLKAMEKMGRNVTQKERKIHKRYSNDK